MGVLGITGTGTEVGKTYVSALIVRQLNAQGLLCAYYKPCASGSEIFEDSDAGVVKKLASLTDPDQCRCSYLYPEPLSPHLAARHTGRTVQLSRIEQDFASLRRSYPHVVVEGAGGIVCPVVHEEGESLNYEQIFRALALPLCVVAAAGLGTINHTVLTCEYLRSHNFEVRGVLLNRFDEHSEQHRDNLNMIEAYTGLRVIATVAEGALSLSLREAELQRYMA